MNRLRSFHLTARELFRAKGTVCRWTPASGFGSDILEPSALKTNLDIWNRVHRPENKDAQTTCARIVNRSLLLVPPGKVLDLFKSALEFETEIIADLFPSLNVFFFFSCCAPDWSERWPQDHHKVEWCEGEAHRDGTGAEVGKRGEARAQKKKKKYKPKPGLVIDLKSRYL